MKFISKFVKKWKKMMDLLNYLKKKKILFKNDSMFFIFY